MAMKAVQCSIENDCAPEHRLNPNGALSHVLRPELELTAEIVIPILVEVDQQIEPSLDTEMTMNIEISVHAEMTSALRLVKPAAHKIWVRN